MQGGIPPKWNELDRIAKLSSMTGIILGTWASHCLLWFLRRLKAESLERENME